MLTVACVLRSGGIYDAFWVARLKAGVERHLPIAHRFVCLSDVDVPCERVPLEHDWAGWWAKLEMFRLPGPVLYFDLDTLIVGDLFDLATAVRNSRGLLMLRDFYVPAHCGSGVMGWSSGKDARLIYGAFSRSPASEMRRQRARMGDQAFIEETVGLQLIDRWQDAVPGQIVSYKVHCRNGIPPNARVVCLHGRPKFGDMPANDPVRQAWEMAA